MSGLLNRIVRRAGRATRDAISYEQTKDLARHADATARAELAAREDVRPEILYYLAEDESPSVRRAIAANTQTPRQADRLLAEDVDDEVRCDLALKIGRLVPQLSAAQKDKVQNLTFEILEVLARDQLPRVRQIVAEEIKHCDTVPRPIIRTLAQDVELIVAAPVLEYSPLLSDEDLLEIIASDPVQGALSAVSRRATVNTAVSDAVAVKGDSEAIAALLANPSAQIREETLDSIIDRAPEEPSWHPPLVNRPDLSVRAIRRIAGFVALALVRVLEERHDLPPEAAAEVRRTVKQRIEETGVDGTMNAELDAEQSFAAGALDEQSVAAAIERGDRDFVAKALALKAELPLPVVRKVLESQSAKSVTALAWAAGLGMRTAIQIQLRVAKIAPRAVLNAKDGIDYPLDEEELRWHVDLFR
ncbi:MAG: DUF2336 domain-containing protein [Alphaproteobacteria bacterium]